MSVSLYMDHHVPSAITEGLRKRRVDVLTAAEDGSSELDDEALLARATELNRILFSRDRDLLAITSEWLREGRKFRGLIYAHQLRIGIGRVIDELELIAQAADPRDVENRVFRLPM